MENNKVTSINNYSELGLYIHIPFCVKKCDYCDFLSTTATEEEKEQYLEALLTEIESYQGKVSKYIVPTIFIGGGTPSSIKADYIDYIMKTIRKVFRIDEARLEATIEVNPGTITREKLRIYHNAGINRLSFGLQSANNNELKLLGRIHSYEQFKENYLMARELGFKNINVDLMSALPGQTLSSWENTLNTIISLEPEHISAYSLIVEEGTAFYNRYKEGADGYHEIPDEETDRLIYHGTKNILKEHGYERYEISNYAKYGYECAHNSSYWIGTEYLGFGLGASSLIDDARFSKLHHIEQYIYLCLEYKNKKLDKKLRKLGSNRKNNIEIDQIGLIQEFEELSENQRMEEFMYLGLRMCNGISKKAFFNRFGKDVDQVYGAEIKQLRDKNLLIENGDNIHLSEYGIDVSNSVLYVFLLN